MPHITLEYSANLELHHDIDRLVRIVHAAALTHELVPLDALRTRAARREHFRVADGSDDLAFVAIHVRIGPGRSAADKHSLLELVLDAAEGWAAQQPALAIAWSIELTEIDATFRVNRNHVRTRLQERPS